MEKSNGGRELTQVAIKVHHPIAKGSIPHYATPGSAALDLRAAIDAPLRLGAGEEATVDTGIAVHIENPGYAALLLPRSGLGSQHGIVLGNLVGLIDSDYQGPVYARLWNRSATAYTVEPGERIAQLMFIAVARPALVVSEEFEDTQRGAGGHGHTGRF